MFSNFLIFPVQTFHIMSAAPNGKPCSEKRRIFIRMFVIMHWQRNKAFLPIVRSTLEFASYSDTVQNDVANNPTSSEAVLTHHPDYRADTQNPNMSHYGTFCITNMNCCII